MRRFCSIFLTFLILSIRGSFILTVLQITYILRHTPTHTPIHAKGIDCQTHCIVEGNFGKKKKTLPTVPTIYTRIYIYRYILYIYAFGSVVGILFIICRVTDVLFVPTILVDRQSTTQFI